jgi:hypothetical protein
MENELVRKEQCPDCAKQGKDKGRDNLAIYSDGQTHCFACGSHGFTEHRGGEALGGVKVKIKDSGWIQEYRGDYYSLPDRKIRGETLEKYRIKCRSSTI